VTNQEDTAVPHPIHRLRLAAVLATLAGALASAAPAHATLVYVKKPAAENPVVYAAADDGSQRRRVGFGRAPAVSPDGNWVAWIGKADGFDQLMVERAGGGATLVVLRSQQLSDLRFSPDSTMVGAVLSGRRLRLYTIAADTVSPVGSGFIHGWSFAPDSKSVAWGRAAAAEPEAESDVYAVALAPSVKPRRLTRTKDALNPLWGAQGIVFDRQRSRADDAPVYNLWSIQPDGSGVRRITKLKIPPMDSGLVPIDLSADGSRLLAAFTGQDTLLGFTVDPQDGATRALSTDFEQGLVGFDMSADGATILGHTGGGDPAAHHDVVTVPYRKGGSTKVIAHNSAYPRWSR
jgi:WD40-like Beta Propeller Repeat